ncbi:protein DpdG [Chlorobium phaeovibrioides]|uniref:protein DpdG n=1 Tax=Chlorobium phaeovibrioides TaxID=1094 RepID=UPI0037BFDFEB
MEWFEVLDAVSRLCRRWGGGFRIDPTTAVRDVLPSIFTTESTLSAKDFLESLANQLPVLDFGEYRKKVESSLDSSKWRPPAENHLSMSLSFALRRLILADVISLDGRADAGDSFRLTGRQGGAWIGFESVRLINKESA